MKQRPGTSRYRIMIFPQDRDILWLRFVLSSMIGPDLSFLCGWVGKFRKSRIEMVQSGAFWHTQIKVQICMYTQSIIGAAVPTHMLPILEE